MDVDNNPQQPQVFGVEFRLRDIGRIIPLKYAILSFGKCLNNLISGFLRGEIFTSMSMEVLASCKKSTSR